MGSWEVWSMHAITLCGPLYGESMAQHNAFWYKSTCDESWRYVWMNIVWEVFSLSELGQAVPCAGGAVE